MINIIFKDTSDQKITTEQFTLIVIPVELPKQKLIHTQWFHLDCLADQYNVPIFSERHWKLIDQYIETAVKHGINMIYTPLFTPPLDTAEGEERPTVQLIEIEKKGNNYRFFFDKLKRWIKLCMNQNIKYFEFSHLFTQGGAQFAPKIMATEDGVYKRIFGWETDARSETYKDFLSQFLPEIVNFIKRHKIEGLL